MSTIERRPDMEIARQLRSRRAVDGLDYLRVLRRLSATMTQVELARNLGIRQPSVSESLRSAAKVPDPREGFCGASAFEIAQRYAAGEIVRDQMLDELSRWDYVAVPTTDAHDWLTDDPEGTFEEVGRALDEGLIDGEAYDVILRASGARRRAAHR